MDKNNKYITSTGANRRLIPQGHCTLLSTLENYEVKKSHYVDTYSFKHASFCQACEMLIMIS